MKKTSISIFEMVALVALLFAPMTLLFVDNQLLFPYITSKNYAWRYAIDIALVAWASLALLDARYRIDIKNPLFISFTLFIGVMGLANMFGVDPYRAFWSNSERMDGYVGLLHIYGFFIVLLGFVKAQVEESNLYNYILIGLFTVTIGSMYATTIAPTMSIGGGSTVGWFTLSLVLMGLAFMGSFEKPNVMKTILHGLLGLGVLFGVMAILQNKVRADAILGNPIYLASYASFAVFISGYFLVVRDRLFGKKYLRQCVYGGLGLFFVLVIFETATRGAILGLLFGGFTTALLCAVTIKKEEDIVWKKIGVGVVLSIVLIFVGFFSFKNSLSDSEIFKNVPIVDRALNFSLEDKTTKHRISNWEMALEGVAERPLLGWGQESYIHVFSKYYRANELHDAEHWFDRTHNMFLDWLLFGGVLGLVTFLSLLGTGIYTVWKYTGERITGVQKSILSGVIVAYMAQNFVAFDSLATGLWIALVLAFIALLGSPEANKNPLVIKDSIAALGIISLLVSLCIWLSISFYQPRAAITSFMRTLQYNPAAGSLAEVSASNLESLRLNFSRGTFVNQEILEQLLSRPQIYIKDGIPSETQNAYFNFTQTQTEKFLEENPHITRVHIFYGTLMHNLTQHTKADFYLKKGLEQSPEKIHFMWALGKNSIEAGRVEEGLAYLKQAAVLAPDSKKARDVYESYLKRNQ